MSLRKVIELARADLGYTENPPGSNMTKYGEAYGMNGVPWCVEALWFWFNEAGERMAFFGGGKTASCSMLLRWYKEQGLTVDVSEVQPGDIVLMNFNGGMSTEHCGLVTKVPRFEITDSIIHIETIEGNTSVNASQSNGDRVCEKTRYPSQIVAVCRPQYKPEEPEAKDDITGRWSEQAIRRVMKRGLMTGYPDGSFKPTQAVTREELAAVLDRMMLEDEGK